MSVRIPLFSCSDGTTTSSILLQEEPPGQSTNRQAVPLDAPIKLQNQKDNSTIHHCGFELQEKTSRRKKLWILQTGGFPARPIASISSQKWISAQP
ncbi:hypothetical protein F2Q70_00036394 [Brassica cretica]|uniref:Uncharacterized protein n=1 Tax=Brassica cretica TaxID=69181 RepID=A0A8S9JR77_BRACR|nr:hypothetical protein F2Q70_00036394 [Brassica cretica]